MPHLLENVQCSPHWEQAPVNCRLPGPRVPPSLSSGTLAVHPEQVNTLEGIDADAREELRLSLRLALDALAALAIVDSTGYESAARSLAQSVAVIVQQVRRVRCTRECSR